MVLSAFDTLLVCDEFIEL
uniref:Uncharacterized protein n=1 Tax=Rhizophora mucronata TaxID=61149 RepID=A0A2P2Q6M2_RHIMU